MQDWNRSRRLLPPAAALAAFEAVAVAGTFGRAAQQLSLTQGAVSRQVLQLEGWLGARLFERGPHGAALTAQGRTYLREIGPALAAIRMATATQLRSTPLANAVELATLPAFGMRWLAPRLPRLMAQQPELLINFSARLEPFDFAVEPFDAAIHFGSPSWPGATCERLFGEEVAPFCAPSIATRLRTPGDLARVPLLALSTRPTDWTRWLRAAGVAAGEASPAAVFEHFMMLAQAAAAGAGAALLPRFLVAPELESGALVCPFDIPLVSDEAYHLAYPAQRAEKPAFQRFRSWLLREARQEPGS